MSPRKPDPGTRSTYITGIDPAAWERFRVRCKRDGVSQRTMMLMLLEGYATGRISLAAYSPDAAEPEKIPEAESPIPVQQARSSALDAMRAQIAALRNGR